MTQENKTWQERFDKESKKSFDEGNVTFKDFCISFIASEREAPLKELVEEINKLIRELGQLSPKMEDELLEKYKEGYNKALNEVQVLIKKKL